MKLVLFLLLLQSTARSGCEPGELDVSVEDGWVVAAAGRDESAHQVRVKIWGAWLQEASLAQLDLDGEKEFVVISRSTGTGPYYRLQIIDFQCQGSGAEANWGVLAWSYSSEGRPRIESGKVFLGEVSADRRAVHGPPNYRPYRLTPGGLVPDPLIDGEDCRQVAPSLVIGPEAGPVVRLGLNVLGDDESEVVEITTTVDKPEGEWSGGECTAHPGIVLKNSNQQALGGVDLPNNYCGGVGLWRGRMWRLADGGAVAGLEFGNVFTKNAAADLHLVYLGRDGSVQQLAVLREVSGKWSSSSGWVEAEAVVRLYAAGESTLISIGKTIKTTECPEPGQCSETETQETDWFEFPAGRAALVPAPRDRTKACSG